MWRANPCDRRRCEVEPGVEVAAENPARRADDRRGLAGGEGSSVLRGAAESVARVARDRLRGSVYRSRSHDGFFSDVEGSERVVSAGGTGSGGIDRPGDGIRAIDGSGRFELVHRELP